MPSNKNKPDSCVPGPGSYSLNRTIGTNARKFTIGPKILSNDPEHMEKKKNIPGPGYYKNILELDKTGKYAVSTYMYDDFAINSLTTVIGTQKQLTSAPLLDLKTLSSTSTYQDQASMNLGETLTLMDTPTFPSIGVWQPESLAPQLGKTLRKETP